MRDTGAHFNKDLAREFQPGHSGAGLAADAGLVVQQIDGVAALAGAHLQAADGTAQPVVGHAHLGRRQVHTGAGQHHISFKLHRVRARCRTHFLQHDGTRAHAQVG